MKTWMWVAIAAVLLVFLYLAFGGNSKSGTLSGLTGLGKTASRDPWYAQLGSGIGNFFSAWSGTSLQADSSPEGGYVPAITRGEDSILGGGEL